MLSSVFFKTIRDRRRAMLGWVVGGAATTAFLVAVFPVIRDSPEFQDFIAELPDGFLSAFGIDPAQIATGVGYLQAQLYSLMAPLLVIIFAVGFGAAATAGEEETGTVDLLLANPVARDRVVAHKLAALTVLTVGLVASFVAVLLIADPMVDLDLPASGVLGINLGLALLGIFFGFLAAAVAAATGRRVLAAAIAGAVAGTTFFINGLAPVVDVLGDLDPFTPFYWYLEGEPLRTGPTSWHLVLAGGALALAAAAVVLFRTRDLQVVRALRLPRLLRRRLKTPRQTSGPWLDSIFAKTLWERRRSLIWWFVAIGGLAAATMSFFPTLQTGAAAFEKLIDAYPREILALFGITDPETVLTGGGFISTRVYSSIGLVMMLILGIGMGAAATAGEEESGTTDLLLATPVTRSRMLRDKAAALVTAVLVIHLGLAVVIAVGNPLVDLDVTAGGILAANLGMALLVILHGTVALVVGARTGRPGRARGIAAAVAIAGFLLNGFGSVVDWLEPLRPFSPFYWYQGDTNPLANSLGWQQALLALGAATLAVVAVPAFRRRDLGT